ncbi:MAG: hypothetical protein ACI9R3_002278 [Verrucomicrobiales bacterium]|jgi:hypothetical protein
MIQDSRMILGSLLIGSNEVVMLGFGTLIAFRQGAGFIDDEFDLALDVGISEFEIRYTINGDEPLSKHSQIIY